MPKSNSNCSCVVCCVFDTCYRIILRVRVFFNLLFLNNFRFTGSHQSFVAGAFFFALSLVSLDHFAVLVVILLLHLEPPNFSKIRRIRYFKIIPTQMHWDT